MKYHVAIWAWCGALAFSGGCAPPTQPPAGRAPEKGFTTLFDGTTLKGWHVSSKTGHSAASGFKTGGKWVVEGGAIVGSQDLPGNGGILITDELFGDFEVALEMNNDFGPDSGLFLRSTEDGKAWQAMIDYHGGGNLMGVYGEGLGGKPSVRNFSFKEKVTEITTNDAPVPFPMPVEQWPTFWKHGQWNELRARIVNNPPTITTWINGVKFMEWTETERRHPDRGGIALQVHGGGDLTKQFVRYRNVRVKPLDGGAAYRNVGVAEFEKLRQEKGAVVLDVRTPEEFNAGHIAGAVNLDFRAPDFQQKVGALDKNKLYLVHCASGGRSVSSCQIMGKLKIPSLYNLEGGYRAWTQAGRQGVK